ncbi:MAG: hypothetical protein GTN62_09785 [Gemmatimonadales bacterium]|nr:hypothetical protein [Gemmatimonadales bacterium]NIN11835.1 hypothetical protein [Gemmatimonadales bacterium]NIN50385.1 hypothetical protein [Gemmatimonadales bacterium]NIP07849.1 hypothetical protein [Gemmatimonadales bacterium]NIR02054.1 hypothetical protein [Gemmatimonadales bacterium]
MESWQVKDLLETLIIAAGSLGALGIVAKTWIATRTRIGRGDVQKLTESVERLHESVEGMRDELGDMSDRLDFAERILAQLAEGKVEQRQLPKH